MKPLLNADQAGVELSKFLGDSKKSKNEANQLETKLYDLLGIESPLKPSEKLEVLEGLFIKIKNNKDITGKKLYQHATLVSSVLYTNNQVAHINLIKGLYKQVFLGLLKTTNTNEYDKLREKVNNSDLVNHSNVSPSLFCEPKKTDLRDALDKMINEYAEQAKHTKPIKLKL